jgi:hypothetical protein
MENAAYRQPGQAASGGTFGPGSVILATLGHPGEKFRGRILSIDPAGVAIRGLDLNSMDNFIQLIKSGEAATASVVFFPMHRVERLELDIANGEIPSLAEQFQAKTGQSVSRYFEEQEK